jgi:hypothetical protein
MNRKELREVVKKAGDSRWVSKRKMDKAIKLNYKYVMVKGEKVMRGEDDYLMVKREPDPVKPVEKKK